MLNVARELRWVDLSLDHWDDIAPMRCAIPVERGSGAMATAIKVGDRFLQPWEYEVECMISALPYTVSGEKDRVRLSMRMVDWKTDEVTSVCWIRLVDGGTWFNDRGHSPARWTAGDSEWGFSHCVMRCYVSRVTPYGTSVVRW